MRQTQDVKAQIEFIIQEQIHCLREREKSCSRIFSHAEYDKWTAEYNRLEVELKKLTSPSPELAPVSDESISPSPNYDLS
jgi:hypothetical protein